jgi:CHAT domain-containing protein
MVDSGEPPPPGLDTEDWRALAWTLKDLCYGAWSSEPKRAARAADALRGLCRVDADAGSTGALPRLVSTSHPMAAEIQALAAWTAGIAQLTRGEMLAATKSFDSAASLFTELGQPQHATQTQVPKIMALSYLGQQDEAVECAERTRQQFIAQGDVRAASKVCLNLGSLHLARDAYAQAARHYREAAVLFARVADHEHSIMADIGLADTLTSMGEFDDALLIYARARMRVATHGFPVLEAMVDESAALLHLARGEYREALGGLERSRQGYERLGMPQRQAIAEMQLADAYLELRLLPEALTLYEQAVVRFEALDAPDELAWALAQHGRTQALLARPDRAAESLRRAAAVFHAYDVPVGEASVALIRAELALAVGNADEALALARSAVGCFANAGMAQRQARAEVLCARALLANGQTEAAEMLFDAGARRACELGLLTIHVQCLTGRGMARLALDQRELSRRDFASAIEVFEEQRRVLPGDEFQRAFLTDHLRPYEELLRMALDDCARTGSGKDAQAVLEWQERYRARALGERIAQGAGLVDDAAAKSQRDRLNWLYRRVQRLQDEAEPVGELVAEIRRTEHELLERARRLRVAGNATGAIEDPVDNFDCQALCQVMREHESLVEFGVLGDELFAAVVTRDGVRVRRQLAHWPEVVQAVRSARFQIESLQNGQGRVTKHMDTLTVRATARLQRVYELIWAPLAETLSQVRRVLVVPYGPLGSLPFGALLDGQRALARELEIAIVPSARVALHGLRSQPRSARTGLIFGESSRLEHAAGEAQFVAGLFPSATTCIDADATLANLRALAPQADVIHFACHAQFRADNPMFSALHLHDGALTVEAAESLGLNRSTVVLSACETALADQGCGDEMVGLVRAFLVAGAARVVASLWPVDDRITAEFMTHFYAALAQDRAPAAALREAQIIVRRKHLHPYYWAAFTLFGGW